MDYLIVAAIVIGTLIVLLGIYTVVSTPYQWLSAEKYNRLLQLFYKHKPYPSPFAPGQRAYKYTEAAPLVLQSTGSTRPTDKYFDPKEMMLKDAAEEWSRANRAFRFLLEQLTTGKSQEDFLDNFNGWVGCIWGYPGMGLTSLFECILEQQKIKTSTCPSYRRKAIVVYRDLDQPEEELTPLHSLALQILDALKDTEVEKWLPVPRDKWLELVERVNMPPTYFLKLIWEQFSERTADYVNLVVILDHYDRIFTQYSQQVVDDLFALLDQLAEPQSRWVFVLTGRGSSTRNYASQKDWYRGCNIITGLSEYDTRRRFQGILPQWYHLMHVEKRLVRLSGGWPIVIQHVGQAFVDILNQQKLFVPSPAIFPEIIARVLKELDGFFSQLWQLFTTAERQVLAVGAQHDGLTAQEICQHLEQHNIPFSGADLEQAIKDLRYGGLLASENRVGAEIFQEWVKTHQPVNKVKSNNVTIIAVNHENLEVSQPTVEESIQRSKEGDHLLFIDNILHTEQLASGLGVGTPALQAMFLSIYLLYLIDAKLDPWAKVSLTGDPVGHFRKQLTTDLSSLWQAFTRDRTTAKEILTHELFSLDNEKAEQKGFYKEMINLLEEFCKWLIPAVKEEAKPLFLEGLYELKLLSALQRPRHIEYSERLREVSCWKTQYIAYRVAKTLEDASGGSASVIVSSGYAWQLKNNLFKAYGVKADIQAFGASVLRDKDHKENKEEFELDPVGIVYIAEDGLGRWIGGYPKKQAKQSELQGETQL